HDAHGRDVEHSDSRARLFRHADPSLRAGGTVIDRDRGAPSGSSTAEDPDRPLDATEIAEAHERRADDVILKKQEDRARSAIQTELSQDESTEPRPRL